MRTHHLAALLAALALAHCGERAAPPPPPAVPTSTRTAASEELPPIPEDPAAIEAARQAALQDARAREADRRAAALARLAVLRAVTKPATAQALEEGADSAYKRQNWKEAGAQYRALALHHPRSPRAVQAAQRATLTAFALGEYEEGLTWHQDAVELFRGTLDEARMLRSYAGILLSAPHWGIEKGGQLIRGRWDQGIYKDTHKLDRARAIQALEEARGVFAEQLARTTRTEALAREQVAVHLELASAIARFTPLDAEWSHWYFAWDEADDDQRVDEEGADERAGNPWWQQQRLHRAEPRGLPVDAEGRVIFHPTPAAYDPGLPDTSRIKALVAEIPGLDPTPNKDLAAEALYRQALFFRARDGADRLARLGGWWQAGRYPYAEEIKGAQPWTLADDQVLGLIATHVGVYRVPDDENVLALLRQVSAKYPRSSSAEAAELAVGMYHQTRQQFPRAIEAFQAFVRAHPSSPLVGQAQAQVALIRAPEVHIQAVRPALAGAPAALPMEHRNVGTLHARAQRIDTDRLVEDFRSAWKSGKHSNFLDAGATDNPVSYLLSWDGGKNHLKYRTGPVRDFSLNVENDPGMRARTSEPRIPIGEPGLWIIELYAEAGAKTPLTTGALMIEGTALVLKSSAQGELAWVVDAATGRPVAGARVDVLEYWTEWEREATQPSRRHQEGSATTSALGLAPMPALARRGQRLITVRQQGRLTWAGGWYSGGYSPSIQHSGTIALIDTDRPVYRPLDEVRLQIWARTKREGEYLPAPSVRRLAITVHDAKGAKVFEKEEAASDNGGARFTIALPRNAALGMYSISAQADGSWVEVGGGQFRVEEYKAPELEVAVSVGDGPAKLGAPIPVSVRATYYFGGPVADARAKYKVYRTDADRRYTAPGPWDWLYGPGYGRAYYAYAWLPWWSVHGPRPWVWYPWWGPAPEPRRELVKEGEGRLDAAGTLRFEIDTAAAQASFGDRDQRFVVEAEITDASRRTIRGEGEVLATRHQFFVNLETDRGYYDAGGTIRLQVRTLLPTEAPIATQGRVRIARLELAGGSGEVVEEKVVLDDAARTDADGRLEHRWDVAEPGQYRLSYVTRDAWGSEVVGSTIVWVWGPGFDGQRFRFNHLEVTTDRRTYQVGETARLLISSDVAGAHLLFSPRAEGGHLLEPTVIALEGKTKVVEVPITAAHVPNFFVEATLVAGGRMSEEVREVFVPPPAAELRVTVTPKSADVRPGREGEVEIRTMTPDGKPIAAEVALSVFDRAVLYIQGELTPDIRKHFWGRLRAHHLSSSSNLARDYGSPGGLSRPELQAGYHFASESRDRMQQAVDYSRMVLTDAEKQITGGIGTRGAGAGGGGSVLAKEAKRESSVAPAATVAAQAAPSGNARDEASNALGGDQPADKKPEVAEGLVTPELRASFADTAAFEVVRTDADGRATVRWKFPDNVTSWRLRALAMSPETRVGEATATITTSKKLMVRLQAPRFFRERDRVMISANVHNYLPQDAKVRVRIEATPSLLAVEGETSRWITVKSGGEARADWWVTVSGEGEATVLVAAESSQESDAKQLTFPVLVHGMEKTVSGVGSISARDPESTQKTVVVEVPAERRVDQTELVVRWSPTLAGAMIDALPFLLEYPYGCTEQTTSRFVPAAITRRVLQQAGGVKLEDLAKLKRSLDPQQLPGEGDGEYKARLGRERQQWDRHPVYNSAVMDDMIASGLARLRRMQKADGGWGWWAEDASSVYTTAYVLQGLWEAKQADVAVPEEMIARGRSAMHRLVQAELTYYRDKDHVSDTDAFFAWVMSLMGDRNEVLERHLVERREKLSVYGKSLTALALWNVGQKDDARLLFRNASQRLKEDPENETMWLETRGEGWWWWWNDEIESNAMFLRAMVAIDPQDPRAPKLIKWLLHHRQNGWYWRSTRDTAMTIGAFGQYLRATGEGAPDYDLEVLVDGKSMKKLHIDRTNLLTFDGELRIRGAALGTGKHEITLKRTGKGALYFNTYLSYFTLEEDVGPAGLEIKVERNYYKLVRDDRTHTVHDQRGAAVSMKEAAYRRVPLATGAQLTSGDLVLVELMVESKNDYAFLAFEDPKPAGLEAVALRSGATYGEAVANLELRDDRVVFFVSRLDQGKLELEYRLRAEIPGTFHAMPARGFAMYAPELRANSSEIRVGVRDGD